MKAAAEGFGSVFESYQPGAVADVRAAAPVVANPHVQGAVTFSHLDVSGGGAGVLGDVSEGFGDGVVRGGLDRLRQPPVDLDVESDVDGGSAGQRFKCRLQAAVRQDGRVQAAGDLAQFF
jgi:hypothetical protein